MCSLYNCFLLCILNMTVFELSSQTVFTCLIVKPILILHCTFDSKCYFNIYIYLKYILSTKIVLTMPVQQLLCF